MDDSKKEKLCSATWRRSGAAGGRAVLAVIVLGGLTLAGCSEVRRTVGLDRSPPDEFAVVQRAPLSLPPDFNLRPPEPGAPRPQEDTASRQGAAAVFGGSAPSAQPAGTPGPAGSTTFGAAAPSGQAATASISGAATLTGTKRQPVTTESGGESAFLALAGVSHAQPNIRTTVNEESSQLVEADRHWIDSLLFWRKPQPPGTVVDAQAESRRLQENAALGKPVTEGQTPIIERRTKAPLEGLFN